MLNTCNCIVLVLSEKSQRLRVIPLIVCNSTLKLLWLKALFPHNLNVETVAVFVLQGLLSVTEELHSLSFEACFTVLGLTIDLEVRGIISV